MSEELRRIKEERGLMERIASYIPGYRGYKEKELRRETDFLVRQRAVRNLKAALDRIRSRLAGTKELGEEDRFLVERLITRMDIVKQKVDRATRGYAGLFDAVKVREERLDRLIEYDYVLIDRSSTILTKSEELARLKPGSEEYRRLAEEVLGLVEDLDGYFNAREVVLKQP